MNAPVGSLHRLVSPGRSATMAALARLPIFLALDGRRALVAGGTPAAAWKAELLSAAGAAVDVYAPSVCDELLAIAANPPRAAVTVHRRKWRAQDLEGCALAIGACEEDSEAQTFAAAARAAGVLVNVIDKPEFCDFSFGSIVNRSPLVVGISTDGAAPVFAQAVRARIEMLLPQSFSLWVAAAARWRSALKEAGLTFAGRRKFWQLFTAHAMADPDHWPDAIDFESWLGEVRSLGPAADQGSITLISVEQDDPELLTLRAVQALQSADVILFDEGVSSRVMDFARREARKIAVDVHATLSQPDALEAQMTIWAKSGKRVVRLSSGNANNSVGAAEIAACRAASVAVKIVPGLTARSQAALSLIVR
jgi:uroporphyrin-III C-methyltransferase/precorrin-2 dehydrogenase/sirohydrochlorin ferrochelatase